MAGPVPERNVGSRPGWPLTGRTAEVNFAVDAIVAGGSVVIAGVGGVGKTRLMSAVAAELAGRGWSVEQAVGTHAARTIPLAALAPLLPPAALDVPRERILTAIVDALVERTGRERLLVCVDDAHLLDDSSATLIGLLARVEGVSLLVAVRGDEPAPDAITGLWKDDLAARFELQPLSETETGQLLAAALDGPVDRQTVRTLWHWTQGNVLYLRELVHDGQSQGTLHDHEGVWRWSGPPSVSPTLSELIGAAMRELDAARLAAMEAIAITEPVAFAVIESIVAPGTIDGLERDGLVRVSRDGRRRVVRVGHPLYGEALRSSTPTGEADRIRVRVADAIAATGMRRASDELHVAVLRVDAGAATDQDLLASAARRAWLLTDTDLVQRLVEATLAVGPHAEASYLHGETLADHGRYEDALACWMELLDGECSEALRARMAAAAATVLAFASNRPDDAKAVLADARSLITDADLRARIDATRATLFVHLDDPDELLERTNDLLAAAETSDETRIWAWIASARLRMTAGEYRSVIREADEAVAIAEKAREWPLAMLFAGICHYFALQLDGRLDEAEALAAESLERALGDPLPFSRAYWAECLGLVRIERGDLVAADEHLSQTVALLRANDNGSLRNALSELALVRALMGDPTGATDALAEAELANQGILEPVLHPDRARAAAFAAEGNATAALSTIREHVAWAEAKNEPYYELPALHDLARYGAAADAVERLRDLATRVEGPIVQAHVAFAEALASSDGPGLLAAADAYEAVGMLLAAAEAATVAATAGGSDANARLRGEALARRCPGARTHLLVADSLSALSPREHEVAALAAGGLSDAEVAARLYISVRTVNAHLRSVYSKLGVTGRKDLAAALGRSRET